MIKMTKINSLGILLILWCFTDFAWIDFEANSLSQCWYIRSKMTKKYSHCLVSIVFFWLLVYNGKHNINIIIMTDIENAIFKDRSKLTP